MRHLAFVLAFSPLAAQQPPTSQIDVFTYDTNGNRVLAGQQIAGGGGSEQRVRNLNGRFAPLEKVEEKVVREDSTGRVVERTIRPFDASGNPQPPERIRITEQKQPDGTKSIDTQVFRGDINGGFSLAERRQAVERTGDGRVTIETQVARPTINGGLDTVEKLNTTVIMSGKNLSEDTLIYRRDPNGAFYTAARKVVETQQKNGTTVENTASYASAHDRHQLELTAQTVAETVKHPDGSETRQVNVFGTNAPGRPATGQPVLREQQIIERNRTANGAVETLSIRRPAVDNPNSLGPVQKISEKVCSGPCQ